MFTAAPLDKTFDYENMLVVQLKVCWSIFILKIQGGTIEKWMQSLIH